MTIKYKTARQRPRALYIEVDYSDLPSGTFVALPELPNGAVVTGGSLRVLTASNAGTSETLSLGTSGAPTGLVNAADSKVAARTAITVPNAPLSGATTYGLTRTAVGTAATQGTYAIELTYLVAGSADFSQG